MKRLAIAQLTTIGLTGLAHAADLQTTKAAAESLEPDCFSSLWTYLNASADDCSLTYAGITLYGALDGGYGYSTHGAPGNPSAGYLNYTILRSSGNAHWLWSPNALGTSVIGLKMKEDLGYVRLVVDRRRGGCLRPLFWHAHQRAAIADR